MPNSPARKAIATGSLVLAVSLLPADPARAGLLLNYGAFDSLSAHPTAGAIMDSRLSSTALGSGVPLAWSNSLLLGNGSWELGLVSNVVSRNFTTASGIASFDNLAPWARFKLPTLWGVPVAILAGATIPAATGSASTPNSTAAIGLATTLNWDGDQVDVNVGVRANPGSPSDMQGVVHVLFTHPFRQGLVGSAELGLEAGSPAAGNILIERLGFTKTWNDNFATDMAVTLGTPLGTGALPTLTPTLGMTYDF